MARISLCVIAGNEAAHIERLLGSFSDAFDELSLVRALGTTEPDETESIARSWCEKAGKAFLFSEYKNKTQMAHVDDFAAARNQAFDRATGDWLFWADCDDVVDSAAALRKQIEKETEHDMLRFPYSVPQSGKLTMRERAIRASLFREGRKWHWPVHENLLVFENDKWKNLHSPIWIHSPIGKKAGGDKRNLRILTAALADAPTNYYYCHQENFHLQRNEQARRFGEIFLKLPNGNSTLRYQCLLNLCHLSDTKEDATIYALRAHHLYPSAKEALASLVKCAFQEDSVERALHWSNQLFSTPPISPENRLWCYEPKWDGWARYDLRARALRLAGKDKEADALEATMRGGLSPRITLLHATRNRVNRAIQCRELWFDQAERPELIEHIFAIDSDDEKSTKWLRSFKHVRSREPNCVSAWNEAARAAKSNILVQLSDDWTPCAGWDTKLLAEVGSRDPAIEPFVIAVSDGNRKDQLLCMAILSRARWKAQNEEMFSSDYESMYSDNEFSFRAWRDGIVIDARERVRFNHSHPSFGTAEMDETYRRQNAPEKYERGEATFRRRNPDAP